MPTVVRDSRSDFDAGGFDREYGVMLGAEIGEA